MLVSDWTKIPRNFPEMTDRQTHRLDTIIHTSRLKKYNQKFIKEKCLLHVKKNVFSEWQKFSTWKTANLSLRFYLYYTSFSFRKHITTCYVLYLIWPNTEHFFDTRFISNAWHVSCPRMSVRQYPGRMTIDHATTFHLLKRRGVGRSPICHYISNHTLVSSRSNHHKSPVNIMERVFRLSRKALLAVLKLSRFVRMCCLQTSRIYVRVVYSLLGNSTCR